MLSNKIKHTLFWETLTNINLLNSVTQNAISTMQHGSDSSLFERPVELKNKVKRMAVMVQTKDPHSPISCL